MEASNSSSAPVRVDLAGGWTDVGPYPNDFGGEVVNFAINLRVFARISADSKNDEADFEFPVPRGSGLGTSSAMYVAQSALYDAENIGNPEKLAEAAFVLESESGNYCGRQDQWASAIGGFNHLLFIGDSVERMPFEPMRSSVNWLKKHLVISFSGKGRNSGDMQESVWTRYSNGDEEVILGLHKIRSAARVMANGLQQDRRDMVVGSLNEVCEGVDLIDRAIHGPFRDVIEPLIGSGSAVAWKALGAGGGGCSAILCSPTGREDVVQALERADWSIIDWDFEDKGVTLHD